MIKDFNFRLCTKEEVLENLKDLVKEMKENPDEFQTLLLDSYSFVKEKDNE